MKMQSSVFRFRYVLQKESSTAMSLWSCHHFFCIWHWDVILFLRLLCFLFANILLAKKKAPRNCAVLFFQSARMSFTSCKIDFYGCLNLPITTAICLHMPTKVLKILYYLICWGPSMAFPHCSSSVLMQHQIFRLGMKCETNCKSVWRLPMSTRS